MHIGHLHAALADADAYTARSRAERLLHGLGFSHEQMGEPVASFSGGWRMRLNLAQALMCPSDLLLLDEPTNHLDLDAILWVEDWLKRYGGTLFIISHDRDFLDGVVNVVVNIDSRKLKRYSGNYSSFEAQRAAAVVLASAQYEKQSRERAHLESFINRFRAKASKAKQATLALIYQGADVIMQDVDAAAPGVFNAVQERKDKGVYAMGTNSDQNSEAPDVILASSPIYTDKTFVAIAKAAQAAAARYRPNPIMLAAP